MSPAQSSWKPLFIFTPIFFLLLFWKHMSSYIKLLISTQIGALPCNKKSTALNCFPIWSMGAASASRWLHSQLTNYRSFQKFKCSIWWKMPAQAWALVGWVWLWPLDGKKPWYTLNTFPKLVCWRVWVRQIWAQILDSSLIQEDPSCLEQWDLLLSQELYEKHTHLHTSHWKPSTPKNFFSNCSQGCSSKHKGSWIYPVPSV